MIPVELDLYNFLAYQDPGPLSFAGIDVACLAGPNGAGKSSVLDAITWSLWGKARSNSPDDLVHQGKEEMRVSFIFEQGGQRYQVIRGRRSGGRGQSLLDLQVWNPEVERWKGISESTMRATQAKIDELLRLDYETFVNSAFLAQGRADEFTTKTPSQRKQVLATILGLAQWERYEARAKEAIAVTRSDMDRLEGRLEEIERELAMRETYQQELEQAEAQAQEAEAKLEAAEGTWAELEDARRRMVEQQKKIDDITERLQAYTKDIEEADREREEAAARADVPAIEAALGEVKGALEGLEPLGDRQKEITERLSSRMEETARLEGENKALVPETEPLTARVETLERAQEPICPTCGQPLTEEHRAEVLGDLRGEIEKRRDQYRSNREGIRQLKEETEELKGELAQLEGKLEGVPDLRKRVGELESSLEHAGEAARQVERLEGKLERWRAEREEYRKKREILEREILENERRLEAAALTQGDLDRLRLENRMASEKVGGARQKLQTLDSLEEQKADRQERLQQLGVRLGLLEDLREAFSKRGVPAMIIETAVPELERYANHLLRRMTQGRMNVRVETQREIKTGELREALDIIISDELGSRPYEMYSGGESFRINFAIRIALSRLLANRAGAQLRSLFIDEGFGTQDEQGREHLVAAINSIQEDFDRILVITHIEELKEAFPNRIEVRKTPEGSQFTLV